MEQRPAGSTIATILQKLQFINTFCPRDFQREKGCEESAIFGCRQNGIFQPWPDWTGH
jgi:hypothetical protein